MTLNGMGEQYIIKIDGNYLVGFEGNENFGIQLSFYKDDAKVFGGKINLKSALDKIYDRMRYDGFAFEHLKIHRRMVNA